MTVTGTPPSAAGRPTRTEAIFVVESVVRSDTAASASASSVAASPPAATCAMVTVTLSTGSRVPMTPVERWSTCSGVAPIAAATARPMVAWSASPPGPVAALALPEVAMTARAYPAIWSLPPVARRLARESCTGAAAKRFGVNTAATGTGPASATMRAKSGRPEALMPAVVPTAEKPPGIRAARSTGGRSVGSGASRVSGGLDIGWPRMWERRATAPGEAGGARQARAARGPR